MPPIVYDKKIRKALVSAAGPNMHDVLDCSVPTFKKYAHSHGYDLIIDRSLDDSVGHQDPKSKAARWAKIELMRNTLKTHDLVVWMDADVMITQFDRDIADDVPADCFQAFVLEQFPTRFNPNTGVWAMRNDQESHEFLDSVLSIGQVSNVWADQAAVCIALGWDIEEKSEANGFQLRAKPVNPTTFLARTGWLPPEWNPLGMASRWPSRTMHFAGTSNEVRLPKMQALLASLRKSSKL